MAMVLVIIIMMMVMMVIFIHDVKYGRLLHRPGFLLQFSNLLDTVGQPYLPLLITRCNLTHEQNR
jgi:hypothetical protein